MKFGTPRLLPVVIAATAALLLFKGIGLVTEGGYALVGTSPAIAAGGAAKAPEGGGEGSHGETALGGADMTDQSPTLEDTAVTMELPSADAAAEGGGHGAAPAEGGHGAAPEVGPAADSVPSEACPPTDNAAAAEGHGAEAPAAEGGHGSEPAAPAATDPCLPSAGVNEHGDALPLIKDNASGTMVPLADTVADASSEAAIADRLAARRAELEQREKEIEMRSTLLDAAEKRIDERTAELKALEERIGKLVDDNKAAEQQQFVSLVAMYENMKPKDAATIFDQLDMPVLLGVAKAMNPRKMAPILARMDPMKAKALTDGIASSEAPATTPVANAPEDLTNLPQIVGQ